MAKLQQPASGRPGWKVAFDLQKRRVVPSNCKVKMNRISSSVEHVTRSKECRVSFAKGGPHSFGGDLQNLIIIGQVPTGRLHHIMTIDTEDPHAPLRFTECRFLPLIFPLSYSGGGFISYRIVDELKIEIDNLPGWDAEDEGYFPDLLPGGRARLVPLSYAEKRIAHSNIRDRSILDRWRMKKLWNGEYFKVSGMLDYYSRKAKCRNGNEDNQEFCSQWKFAEFPATKIPLGDVWHEYSSDVSFVFSVCFRCNSIHAHIDCT